MKADRRVITSRTALCIALTLLAALSAPLVRADAVGSSPGCRRVDCLRLNQLQFLSTHNSYHVQAEPDVFALIQAFDPATALTLEYTHAPLAVQLGDERVRHLELDVFADPVGGRYADHHINMVLGKPVASPNRDLYRPGLKVMHAQE